MKFYEDKENYYIPSLNCVKNSMEDFCQTKRRKLSNIPQVETESYSHNNSTSKRENYAFFGNCKAKAKDGFENIHSYVTKNKVDKTYTDRTNSFTSKFPEKRLVHNSNNNNNLIMPSSVAGDDIQSTLKKKHALRSKTESCYVEQNNVCITLSSDSEDENKSVVKLTSSASGNSQLDSDSDCVCLSDDSDIEKTCHSANTDTVGSFNDYFSLSCDSDIEEISSNNLKRNKRKRKSMIYNVKIETSTSVEIIDLTATPHCQDPYQTSGADSLNVTSKNHHKRSEVSEDDIQDSLDSYDPYIDLKYVPTVNLESCKEKDQNSYNIKHKVLPFKAQEGFVTSENEDRRICSLFNNIPQLEDETHIDTPVITEKCSMPYLTPSLNIIEEDASLDKMETRGQSKSTSSLTLSGNGGVKTIDSISDNRVSHVPVESTSTYIPPEKTVNVFPLTVQLSSTGEHNLSTTLGVVSNKTCGTSVSVQNATKEFSSIESTYTTKSESSYGLLTGKCSRYNLNLNSFISYGHGSSSSSESEIAFEPVCNEQSEILISSSSDEDDLPDFNLSQKHARVPNTSNACCDYLKSDDNLPDSNLSRRFINISSNSSDDGYNDDDDLPKLHLTQPVANDKPNKSYDCLKKSCLEDVEENSLFKNDCIRETKLPFSDTATVSSSVSVSYSPVINVPSKELDGYSHMKEIVKGSELFHNTEEIIETTDICDKEFQSVSSNAKASTASVETSFLEPDNDAMDIDTSDSSYLTADGSPLKSDVCQVSSFSASTDEKNRKFEDTFNSSYKALSENKMNAVKFGHEYCVKSDTESSDCVKLKKTVTGDMFCSCISQVLYRENDFPFLRLNMSFWSECSRNPLQCHLVHQNLNPEICFGHDKILQFLIEDERWESALTFLSHIMHNTYPEYKTMLAILACVRESETNIRSIADKVIHSFLQYNPPCATYMKNYYYNVLSSELSGAVNVSSDGIFLDVIHELKEHICNFKNAESGDAQICYDTSERSINRIKQLTFILKLMVEILECDMAVWLATSHNPKLALKRRFSRPLIALLLWNTTFGISVGNFNLISDSKFLISMFATCVKMNICMELNEMLSRLIALIGEIIRASDFDSGCMYPHFNTNTREFVREIVVVFSSYPVSDRLKMVQQISPPWLVMLISHRMLSDFMGQENPINLETAIDFLNSNPEYFQNCFSSGVSCQNKSANINKRDKRGETRLHLLCRNNRLEELSLLLSDPDIDVNAQDNCGWTPLHEAINKGNTECVAKLLNWKPLKGNNPLNIRAKNVDGITPLIYAVMRENSEICKILLERGGRIMLSDRNSCGKTATDIIKSEAVRNVFENINYKVFWNDLERTKDETMHCSDILMLFVRSYIKTYNLPDIVCCLKNRKFCEVNRNGKPKLLFDYVQIKRDLKNLSVLKSALRKDVLTEISLIVDQII